MEMEMERIEKLEEEREKIEYGGTRNGTGST
jgi:hypothetical protein